MLVTNLSLFNEKLLIGIAHKFNLEGDVMTVKKLFFLPAGRILIDQSSLNTNLLPGKLIDIPIWSYLLETSDGPILIDTGMPDVAVNSPDLFKGTPFEDSIIPKMKDSDRIESVLERTGYLPEDLVCIISSHLHFDHAGGNGHFPKTPIIVQRTEYDAAVHREEYMKECVLPDLNYQFIDGDHELLPGVQLLYTPGHSPGHQSVLVETEASGMILLTIDASYTRENFEQGVPYAGVDSNLTEKSIQRLKEIVSTEKPLIFFGHDTEQEKGRKTFPEYL